MLEAQGQQMGTKAPFICKDGAQDDMMTVSMHKNHIFGGAPPLRFTLSVNSVGRWCSVHAGEGTVGSVTWGMSYTDLRRPKSVLRCPARLVCLPLLPDGSCDGTVTLLAEQKGSKLRHIGI
jgi:hypothetical protein